MINKTKGEAFIKLPLALLTSPAWKALGINARRFVESLMIEHMRHGGRRNSFLLAPRRQLVEIGIGEHFISGAIEEAEGLGLVDCKRGVGRRPSFYSLTWLTLADGTPPSNRFLECDPAAEAVSMARKAAKQRKSRKNTSVATAKQHSLRMSAKQHSLNVQTALTKPVATAKQHSQSLKSSSAKQHSLLRKDLTTAEPNGYGEESAQEGDAGAGVDEPPVTKRERERQRYLEINTQTYGLENAIERWNRYEQLILAKYGGDDIEKAWEARDRAH